MTVHLIKLCVGVDNVAELHAWQTERLDSLRRQRKTPEHCHRTMQTPRRRDEVLNGGSLYWVIRGVILVRQRVLDPGLIATRPQARRAFQGWRYLDAADAPQDLRALDARHADMPSGMREELRELRLIDW